MDIDTFKANRDILQKLSREYELLKQTGADVDYSAWVRLRLREAATQLATQQHDDAQHDTSPAASVLDAANGAEVEPATSLQPIQPLPAPQLGFSRAGRASRPQPGRAPFQPAAGWTLHGEGSAALQAAIMGPSGGLRKGQAKPKRVVIMSPKATRAGQHAVPTRERPPVSKLYVRQEPSLFSMRPEASVHPHARPLRPPSPSQRPEWVNTASLQAALRGASAVPHLQAAAERERRLALSVAVARQSVAVGLDSDEARVRQLFGASPAAQAAQTEYDHLKAITSQLARQNEQLEAVVRENNEQLQRQQALLEAALQPASQAGPATDQQPGAAAEATPATLLQEALARRASTSSGDGAAGAAAGPSADQARLTVKERERQQRKESLKAIVKQVLGRPADGQRKLPTTVEEVEVLVAAIHALAKQKGRGAHPASSDRKQAEVSLAPPTLQLSKASSRGHRASSGEGIDGPSWPSRPSTRATSRQVSNISVRSAATGIAVEAPEAGVAPPLQGHGAFAMEGAAAPVGPALLPHSAMIEALEDQVQQIVELDAASFADMARIQRVEQLEQRMHALIDKVDSKLQRALQPLQLNLELGEQHSRARQEEDELAAKARSEQAAGLSVLELHRMLININRMDSQEREIRRKWFVDPLAGPRSPPPGLQPLVVRDGQLGSLLPGPPSPQRQYHGAAAAGAVMHHVAVPTSAAAAAAAAAAQGGASSTVAQQGTAVASADAIRPEALEEVLAGRRRFLKHQRQSDGALVSAANPQLNPIEVVEDLADMLLDEVLLEHAAELTDLCDSVGDQLYRVEFEPAEPEWNTEIGVS